MKINGPVIICPVCGKREMRETIECRFRCSSCRTSMPGLTLLAAKQRELERKRIESERSGGAA